MSTQYLCACGCCWLDVRCAKAMLPAGRVDYLCHAQEARAAQQQTDGWALTKTITFKVTMFDDFEKFGKVPDEYEKPERQPYQPQARTS